MSRPVVWRSSNVAVVAVVGAAVAGVVLSAKADDDTRPWLLDADIPRLRRLASPSHRGSTRPGGQGLF